MLVLKCFEEIYSSYFIINRLCIDPVAGSENWHHDFIVVVWWGFGVRGGEDDIWSCSRCSKCCANFQEFIVSGCVLPLARFGMHGQSVSHSKFFLGDCMSTVWTAISEDFGCLGSNCFILYMI